MTSGWDQGNIHSQTIHAWNSMKYTLMSLTLIRLGSPSRPRLGHLAASSRQGRQVFRAEVAHAHGFRQAPHVDAWFINPPQFPGSETYLII